MRRLSLHASALTDDEYTLYTHALKELAEIDVNQPQGTGGAQGADGDDEYYEGIRLGVREVRAWLRGRYAGKVDVGGMDSILKFFSPTLAPSDTLTGGQFFAALRLVTHVVNGRELDRGLAFVQARPSDARPQPQAKHNSRPPSPSKKPVPPPPRAQPPQHPQHTSHPPYPPFVPHASSSSSSHSTHQAAPSTLPSTSTSGSTPGPSTFNPFLQHQHQHRGARPTSDGRTSPHKGPPLPPRKSTAQGNSGSGSGTGTATGGGFLPPPPPRHRHHHSYSSSSSSGNPPAVGMGERAVPLPPPKPPATGGGPSATGYAAGMTGFGSKDGREGRDSKDGRDTYTQSLQASKAAHSAKKAEEVREKERVMQVLKRSSGAVVPAGMGGIPPFRSNTTTGSSVGVPPPPPQHTKPLRSQSPSKTRPPPSVPSSSSKPHVLTLLSSSSSKLPPTPHGLGRVPPLPPSISSISRSSSTSTSSEDSRSRSYSNPASTSYPPHSNSNPNSYSGYAYGRYAPTPPHRRPSSVSVSVSSLEQVALARAPSLSSHNHTQNYGAQSHPHPNSTSRSPANSQPPSRSGSRPRLPSATYFTSANSDGGGYTQSPFGSPSRAHHDLPAAPPPRHPDRRGTSVGAGGGGMGGRGETFDEVYGESAGGVGGREREWDGWERGEGVQWARAGEDVFRTPVGSPGVESPTSSPTARVFRSHSFHQPSSPRLGGGPGPSTSSSGTAAPEVPPRRRKRPESMQIGMLRRVSGGGGTSPFDDDLPTVDTDSQSSPTYGSSSHSPGGHLAVPPPLPPPRRKVTSGGGSEGGAAGLVRHSSLSSNGSGRGVHRRSSLSVGNAGAFSPTSSTALSPTHAASTHEPRSPGTSPFASTTSGGGGGGGVSPLNMKSMLGAIERTGQTMNEKLSGRLEQLQPKLEKARFKAEAGLNSRRGFIPPPHHNPHHANAHLTSRDDRESREGLMGGRDDEPAGDDGSGEDSESFWTPRDDEVGDDGGRGRSVGRREERDGMKWPVAPGEGWVAL